MVAAGTGGRLIAVTSVHAHQPMVGSSAYNAAKHGLDGLMKNLALELGSQGISAVSVAPGAIATTMSGQTDIDPPTVDRPGIPLGRPGDAREVAALIAFPRLTGRPRTSPAPPWSSTAACCQELGPQAGNAITAHDWRTSLT